MIIWFKVFEKIALDPFLVLAPYLPRFELILMDA
jgi:hypothetical protein